MELDQFREIRDIRRQISKECGDDPEKVFAYYVEHQKKMKVSGKYTFVTKPVARASTAAHTEQTDEPKSE